MQKPILNLADVDLQNRPPELAAKGAAAERFDARMGMVGTVIGAQKLGYNITAVPPGKRAFPFHNHHVNEEMFFVLEGTGEVRIGADTYPIRQGDFIACPAGGHDTAHQIINTGAVELKYLAVSTKSYPEVAEYPDSNKVGVYAMYDSSMAKPPRNLRFVTRDELGIDYWDGE